MPLLELFRVISLQRQRAISFYEITSEPACKYLAWFENLANKYNIKIFTLRHNLFIALFTTCNIQQFASSTRHVLLFCKKAEKILTHRKAIYILVAFSSLDHFIVTVVQYSHCNITYTTISLVLVIWYHFTLSSFLLTWFLLTSLSHGHLLW